MAFRKGEGGRPKGAKNKDTKAAQIVCQRLVTNRDYLKQFRKRFLAGELPQKLEEMVWHYAYRRPPQPIDFDGTEEYRPLFMLPPGVRVSVSPEEKS